MMNDLKNVIEYQPDILIVVTGANGILKIPEKTVTAVENLNIKLVAKMTPDTYKLFNEYISKKSNVVGTFHLTC